MDDSPKPENQPAIPGRRGLLIGALGLGISFTFYRLFNLKPLKLQTPEAQVAGLLEAELHYLSLEPEGVKAFVTWCAPQLNTETSRNLQLICPELPKNPLTPGTPEHEYVLGVQKQVAELYLVRSDFFRNQCDESKTVRYLGQPFFGPTVPCGNPFANFELDS